MNNQKIQAYVPVRPRYKKKNKGRLSNRIPNAPPRVNFAPMLRYTFRYKASQGGSYAIPTVNFFCALCMQSSGTTTSLYSLIAALRLRKVNVWAPAIDNGSNEVSVQFNSATDSSVGIKPSLISDTSMGGTNNAKISVKPPRESSAADWQTVVDGSTITTGLNMTLNVAMNSIIDVVLEIVLTANTTPLPVGIANTSMYVAGTIYTAPLDVSTGFLVSQGLNGPPSSS